MKTKKLSLILSGLMIVTAIIVASCKKSTTTTPTPTPDTSTTSATDNNMAQQSSHDITNIGSQGIENDNGSLSTYRNAQGGGLPTPQSGSVSVVVDTVNKKMTVTFYSYFGWDGHTRNGTIVYDWHLSAPNAVWFRDSGLVLNVTTPNIGGVVYTVDNNTITINNKQIENKGRNSSGQLYWTDVSNITITKPSGGTPIQWNGNWTITLLNTSSYVSIADNGTASTYTYTGVFHGYGGGPLNYINWGQALVSVSGTFGGTASDGETYTGSISSGSPLVLNLNCTPSLTKYLYVSGTLNFTPTGKTTRTINYGSGVCDLTYNVAIGAFNINITI